MMDKYGEDVVYKEGFKVYIPTTPELSLYAKTAIQDGLRAIDKRQGIEAGKKIEQSNRNPEFSGKKQAGTDS